MFLSKTISFLLICLLITISAPSDADDINALMNEKLFKRVFKGDREAVSLLLDMGADPNATRGDDNETVLMWASKHGRSSVVALLLERGAKPNLQDAKGYTALMWACRENDYPNVVEILLKYKADLSIEDKDNEKTALVLALENNHFNTVRVLFEYQKCVEALNITGIVNP